MVIDKAVEKFTEAMRKAQHSLFFTIADKRKNGFMQILICSTYSKNIKEFTIRVDRNTIKPSEVENIFDNLGRQAERYVTNLPIQHQNNIFSSYFLYLYDNGETKLIKIVRRDNGNKS